MANTAAIATEKQATARAKKRPSFPLRPVILPMRQRCGVELTANSSGKLHAGGCPCRPSKTS